MTARPSGGGMSAVVELAVPQRAELLWVEGDDAGAFLNGLLTNDIEALDEGDSQRSLLLDSKGRIRTFVRVRHDAPGAYTLVLQAGDGGRMLADLERYHFSEQLEILGPEPVETLVVEAGAPVPLLESAELDTIGWIPDSRELVVAEPVSVLAAAGRSPGAPQDLDALRIRTGTPMPGRDFQEAALVHELGIERIAVSFTKGCYLGQETVARVEHRGNVKRRLRLIALDAAVAEGAPLVADGDEVGRLGTVAELPELGWAGLAIVRTSVAPGDEVRAGHITGRIAPVPVDSTWWPDGARPG